MDDSTMLGLVIHDLVEDLDIRNVAPHRFALLRHLVIQLVNPGVNRYQILWLMSHPSVQSECRLHQLICAMSDYFETESRRSPLLTRVFTDSVLHIGG